MEKVLLVPYGGLGNQMFQIAAALSSTPRDVWVVSNWGFARRNSGSKIEIEAWEFNSRVKFFASPNGNKLSRRLLNFMLRLGAQNRRRILLRILELFTAPYFSLLIGHGTSVSINRGLGFSKLSVQKRTMLIGYFQCAIFAKSVINELLSSHPKYLSEYALMLIEEAKSKSVLVVHIRRGDYANEAFGVLSDSYYERALEIIKHDLFQEIWVFSDDIESAKLIRVLNEKKNVKFIEDKTLESSEVLEVMRFGSGFVIANSSFSWWAAQLRYKRIAQVVCPSPWFKFTKSPEGIIDDEWLALSW
jgi:hypothetical protein